MPLAVHFAVDLVAILVLAYGVYFRRHQRRDMATAYVALNIGVMAVATALDRTGAAAGLGLGLFGVLSIIRLRSAELTQEEVAYYFVSLAMGLLAGLHVTPDWVGLGLIAILVGMMFAVDHPAVLSRSRQQTVTLDTAYTDEAAVRARLESMLGAEVRRLHIRKLDLVHDTTTVEVSYRLPIVRNGNDGTGGLLHRGVAAGNGR